MTNLKNTGMSATEEQELLLALKELGITRVAARYPMVKPEALNAIREKHGIARKPPGPPKMTAEQYAAQFSDEDKQKLQSCRSVSEALRLLGLTSSATNRVRIVMRHLGVVTGPAAKSPDLIASKHGFPSVEALAQAMVLMNNTEAGIKFGMSNKAVAALRIRLDLPPAKNGRSFRQPLLDAPLPTSHELAVIVRAHEEMGSSDAREWLAAKGLDRTMVNRTLSELDASGALTPSEHVASLSPDELAILQDPFIDAIDASTRIRSLSLKRLIALRQALGVRKDALGRVLHTTGMTREQLRSLIEFEGLEDAASLISVSSSVVVKVRKALGLPARPYQPRLSLNKAMPRVYELTGASNPTELRAALHGISKKALMKRLELPRSQVELLLRDLGATTADKPPI